MIRIMNTGPDCFTRIGENCQLDSAVSILNRGAGRLIIGDNFHAGYGANIFTYGGHIEIGDNCVVNNYSVIYGHGGLKIGNDVIIGPHTVIIPANHKFTGGGPIRKQGETRRGIIIGNDCWIGANCTILDGVTVASGCVIGAGSVVTKSTDIDGVYAGNPAVRVRDRF